MITLKHGLFTADDIKETYAQIDEQLLIRYIIKYYSTNKSDIRDCALRGLNLSKVKKVLDIGCGYGFFIEKLKGLLRNDAIIIGIDMVENNREPFLHSVGSINYKGEFITSSADIIKDMALASFDLIISSYSLYFFPHLIQEISRILVPEGLFLALTHSKNSMKEILSLLNDCIIKTGISDIHDLVLNRLFKAFSAETGNVQLENDFQKVEIISYDNKMIFPLINLRDCMVYINNKKKLLYKDVVTSMPDKVDLIMNCLKNNILEHSKKNGMMIINKDDGIFRCYKTE